MLPGIAGVIGFLALLLVIEVIRNPELVLSHAELVLKPVPDGLSLLTPAARAQVPALEALGFERIGVFRPAPPLEVPPAGVPPPGAPPPAAPPLPSSPASSPPAPATATRCR